MFWLMAIPLLFFAAFLILHRRNRASLIPSFAFTVFLFSALGASLFLGFYYYSENTIMQLSIIILSLLLFVLFIVIVVFGIYALITFLLLNAIVVLNKEKRTLANCLTLILAVGIILYMIVINFIDNMDMPVLAYVIELWIQGLIVCYTVHLTQFIIAVALCNLFRPRKNQDYILVHGSGLNDGKITPLLAGRVDKAITFYNTQKKSGNPPKIIFSGGRGKDEPRPESEAMAEYAKEKGISKSDILLESKSSTTLENMQFSKQIIEADANGEAYHAIYVTSNYHLLRAGIYARKVGLKINGIGSGTAFYYLPNALLREYIAYFSIYRKQNVIFIIFCFLLSCIISLLLIL